MQFCIMAKKEKCPFSFWLGGEGKKRIFIYVFIYLEKVQVVLVRPDEGYLFRTSLFSISISFSFHELCMANCHLLYYTVIIIIILQQQIIIIRRRRRLSNTIQTHGTDLCDTNEKWYTSGAQSSVVKRQNIILMSDIERLILSLSIVTSQPTSQPANLPARQLDLLRPTNSLTSPPKKGKTDRDFRPAFSEKILIFILYKMEEKMQTMLASSPTRKWTNWRFVAANHLHASLNFIIKLS